MATVDVSVNIINILIKVDEGMAVTSLNRVLEPKILLSWRVEDVTVKEIVAIGAMVLEITGVGNYDIFTNI